MEWGFTLSWHAAASHNQTIDKLVYMKLAFIFPLVLTYCCEEFGVPRELSRAEAFFKVILFDDNPNGPKGLV